MAPDNEPVTKADLNALDTKVQGIHDLLQNELRHLRGDVNENTAWRQEFTKENGNDYMDLYGRALVDVAIDLINGYLFCGQAGTKVDMAVAVANGGAALNGQTIPMKKRKAMLARRYVEKNAPKIKALTDLVCQGDKSSFTDYEALVGSVPEE